MNRTRIGALAAGVLTLACASSLGIAPASAATRSLVAQSTYYCPANSPGTGSNHYKVTLRMQLNAPTSVAPGGTVDLSGVLTLQFDETLYASAKVLGVNTVDGYSSTLSVTSALGGATSVVTANRWQTSPTAVSDPIVVSAPITFPAYTVPASATGAVTLGLPQNGTTADTAANSPAKVAFTLIADAKTSAQDYPVNFACYLTSGSPGRLGSIPIVAAKPATTSSSGGTATASQPATAASGQAPAAPAAVGSSPASAAPAAGAVTTGGTDTTGGAGATGATGTTGTAGSDGATTQTLTTTGTVQGVPVATTAVSSPTVETRSGVYVPTGLLVFGGAAICMAALVYAGVTNARLRMIRRSIDD